MKPLESRQQLKSEVNTSWLSSLINTIIGNLKFSITNIHIRYEYLESNPGHPFAAGITLAKLSAVTVDDGGKETFVTVNLGPLNPGYYVLLSNMDACLGQWREVIRVRNLMKLRGIEKTPGSSLIEVDSTIHEFVVGDKTHPETQEIYAKLEEISERLHLVGYMPDTSVVLFDLDEEEKAQNLSVHSEKLAVAFGLLKTSVGKPIRMVKNLRVCCDCHIALKLIPNVYERDIIVKDRNRFHHFKDGICSCNKYW